MINSSSNVAGLYSDDFWKLYSQTHRVQTQAEALIFHLTLPNPHAFELAAQGRDPVWGLSHTFQHKTPLGRPLIRLRRGPWVERPKPFPEREREIYRLCFFYTCSSFPRRCEGPPLSWAVNIPTNANLFRDVPISPPIMFDSDLKLPRLVLVKASKGYWITYYSSFS